MQIRIILKVWNFLESLGMVKQVTRNYWEFLGILSISKTIIIIIIIIIIIKTLFYEGNTK